MPVFKYRTTGTYIIASQGTGTGAAGYQIIVAPKEGWTGSVTLKQNTAPAGSTPVYVDVAYQNADTAVEVAAGTAITTDAAVIVSPTAGDLVAVVTVPTGAVNISVNPASLGVTNNELMTAFEAAGYSTAGQDTTEAMLSVAVADMLGTTFNVKAFGAVGDGVTDDTTAMQDAIDAASAAGGGVVYVPVGTYAVGSTIQMYRLVRVVGAGMDASILSYTATSGPMFQLGSYDGAKDFASSPPGQQYEFSELTMRGVYNNTTTAGRAAGTPYAIADYESGHARIIRVRAQGWYVFFWGIASDFNYIEDLMAVNNGTVFEHYNRTDQALFNGCKGYGNNTYFKFRGCSGAHLLNPQFIENTGADVDIAGSEQLVTDPFGNGTFPVVSHGSEGILIENPWFELYHTTGSASEHEVGQPTKPCFVSLGSAPDTAVQRPTTGVTIINPHFHTISDDAPNVPAVECFILQHFADRCSVVGTAMFEREVEWPLVKSTSGTTVEWTSAGITRRAFSSDPDLSALRICGRDRRYQWAKPSVVADAPPQDANAVPLHKTEVLFNPDLAPPVGSTTPSGWTLRSNTTAAAYSLVGDETSRSGTPLELTASANLAGMQQAGLRLRGGVMYEITLRYKTSADSEFWQFAINPNPAGGGIPSSAWMQYLQPQDTFAEVTFRVTTYDVSTISAPRLAQFLYLGSTSGDKLILDYVSVREVAPFATREPMIRQVSGDRGNADVTLTPGVDAHTQRFAAALTQARTITLATGWMGAWFRVVRTGAGAFNLDVGGLKTLTAADQWCEVEHDGSAWRLTAYGTL